MRFEKKYLINEDLVEMRASTLVTMKSSGQAEFFKAATHSTRGEVPLVSSDGILAGMRYPSSVDGRPDFYLPQYALRTVEGRRTTRLEMFPPSADPTAPAGRLTVEVQALPLATSDSVRMMAHTVELRLGYILPVETDETAESTPFAMSRFTGSWRNTDPDTNGVLTLEIAHASGNLLKVAAIQNGLPDPVDLGVVMAEVRDGMALALFRGADRTVALTLTLQDDALFVTELTDINDPAAPGDFTAHHVLRRDGTSGDRPVIWMALEPTAQVGATLRRSVTAIPDMDSYLRLYGVLTRPEHRAMIEMRATALVGRRSFRQVFVGLKQREELAQKLDAKTFEIDPKTAKAIRKKATTSVLENPSMVIRPEAEFRIERISPAPAAARQPIEAEVLRVPVADAVTPLRQPEGTTAFRAIRREDATAAARRLAILRHRAEVARRRAEAGGRPTGNVPAGGGAEQPRETRPARTSPVLNVVIGKILQEKLAKAKLPGWVVVEPGGKPVLTRRTDTCDQTIAPAWADPELYADMLDAPEDAPGGIVLLRREIRAGAQTAIFYQDGLTPRQVYYEPQEFRLVRADSAPYAPLLLFHLNEEASEDEDAAAPGYSVTMTYRAEPYIDPALLSAARAEFGADSVIAPIVPAASALTIRLPSTDGSTAQEITREDVEIDFADGLNDMITFDEAEYRTLTTAFQTAAGIGLSGQVDVTFPDGRSGQVPVRIGLRDMIGKVFNGRLATEEAGPALAYTNRIESPVRINAFPVAHLPDGARAVPETAPPATALAPAETITVAYRTEPAGSALFDVPPLLDVSTEPDFMAILAQTTVVQGYADDTFDITVAIDPIFFDFVPEGAEPLTAVEVSFRTREEAVVLTPAAPSQTITLPMPHILFLTNAAEAQHYSYSVQDMHASGPGAATAYRAGSGNLDIQPAAASGGIA